MKQKQKFDFDDLDYILVPLIYCAAVVAILYATMKVLN